MARAANGVTRARTAASAQGRGASQPKGRARHLQPRRWPRNPPRERTFAGGNRTQHHQSKSWATAPARPQRWPRNPARGSSGAGPTLMAQGPARKTATQTLQFEKSDSSFLSCFSEAFELQRVRFFAARSGPGKNGHSFPLHCSCRLKAPPGKLQLKRFNLEKMFLHSSLLFSEAFELQRVRFFAARNGPGKKRA